MTAPNEERIAPLQYNAAQNTYFTASISSASSKDALAARLASESPAEFKGTLSLLGSIGPDSMEKEVVVCLSDTPSSADAGSEEKRRQETALSLLRGLEALDSSSVAMMEFKQRRKR